MYENLRITWAITAKDLLEALKNKSTLFNILMAFLMMVVYKELPKWEQQGEAPAVLVYDVGTSALVDRLRESSAVNLVEYESQAELEKSLSSADAHKLGIIVPADFDRQVESADSARLTALTVRWVSLSAVADLSAEVEEEITRLVEKPVHIELSKEPLDVDPGRGSPLFGAMLSIVVVLVMVSMGVVPHLTIEEKQTKTLDALMVSPARGGHIAVAKALTGLFYCLTAATVVYIVNADLIVHWPLAITVAVIGSLFFVSVGLLLGQVLEVRQQLVLWGFVLMAALLMPFFLWVMSELLPDTIASAVRWAPAAALARALRVACWSSAAPSEYGPPLALVAGSGLLVLAVVAWLVRRTDRP